MSVDNVLVNKPGVDEVSVNKVLVNELRLHRNIAQMKRSIYL
jgi:hypothetical protein